MRGRIHRLTLGTILAGALIIGWSLPVANAGITVQSDTGGTIVKFDTFNKCTVKAKSGGGKRFAAQARKGGWNLALQIASFNGFHDYDIEYGTEGPADFYFGRPGVLFSNLFDPSPGPPGPDLTVGGGLGFLKRGRVLGMGFPVAYNSNQPTAWVSFIGTAPCK
jgi:hypothetical protein